MPRSLIISEGSTFKRAWSIIYLLSCFTSPYFYAWVALNGHEKDEKLQLFFAYSYESIFAFNICINFLTDFVPDGEIVPEKDMAKIADRYLNGDFLQDFVPTFPLTFFFDNSNTKFWRLLYLVKIIRLIKGIEVYDV